MKCFQETHILALDVRNSRIGYALFAGPKRLLDWGISTIPSRCSNRAEWMRQRITELLRHDVPECIVTRPHRRAKLPPNAHSRSILNTIQSVAAGQGIPIHVIGRDEIGSTFCHFRARTKEEIACAIVGIFPELLVRLPPKRKTWQKEARGMIVFDAIATGIAYWQRSPPQT